MFHVPEAGKAFSWFMDNKIPLLLILVGINLAVYVVSTLLVRRADKETTPNEERKE